MSDGPKLYTSKPRKGQLKPKIGETLSSAPDPPRPPPSPPMDPPPKESFARRYKFAWPLLLSVNLALAAYLFIRTKKKDLGPENSKVTGEVPPHVAPVKAVSIPSEKISTSNHQPVMEPASVRQPISEDEQLQLFKWILEEKRKMKPADPSEKRRIDEEKAILKQYIRTKSIPSL